MNDFRWIGMVVLVGVLASCTTTREPAPVQDRSFGASGAAETAVVSPFAGKPGYYTVKRGDTVMQISRNTGQKPTDIIAWNHLTNPNALNVGQVVRVAPPDEASGTASGAAAPAVAAMNKTAPRGEKQPYSESTLSAMRQADGAPAAVSDKPALASAESGASQNAVATASAAGWQWPADGKLIATFKGNKNKGIDIAGTLGQPVKAAADGKVSHVGPLRGYGNMVIVKHNDNLNSVYAHNSRILVKEGDTVSKGQPIAEMGKSDSDAVVLRFEIRQHGKPVDPSQYLPPR